MATNKPNPHPRARRSDASMGANRKGRRAAFVVDERLGLVPSLLIATAGAVTYKRLIVSTEGSNAEALRVTLNDGRRALVIVETFDSMRTDARWGTLERAKETQLRIPESQSYKALCAPGGTDGQEQAGAQGFSKV